MKPHYLEIKDLETGEIVVLQHACNRKAADIMKQAYVNKYKAPRYQIWIRKTKI